VKIQKKSKKKLENKKKYVVVRKDVEAPKKIAKNWLRRFKNANIEI